MKERLVPSRDCPTEALLPAIEAELAASDLTQAYRLAVQVPDPSAHAVTRADPLLAKFSLRALEAATYFGCSSTAMRAERMATQSLLALSPENEGVERLSYGMAMLRSESARISGSLDWMVRATGHAVRLALKTAHRRTDFERYQACWEVVELLAALGQHSRAADIGQRMQDFAATRLGDLEATESGVLVRLCAEDLEGMLSRRIDSAPPRFEGFLSAGRAACRSDSRRAADIDALQSLAGRARALGRENWALRAQQRVEALVIEDTVDPTPFATVTLTLQALGAHRGIRYLEHAQLGPLAWCDLLARRRDRPFPASAPNRPASPPPTSFTLDHARRLYRDTCAARLEGHSEHAWSLYAEYLRVCSGWPWRDWLAKGDDLHAAAEILVALPQAGRRPRTYPAECIGLVQSAIREARKSTSLCSMSTLAESLQVTPRRVQQAFKTVGLPSPQRYLRGSRKA